MALPPRPFSSLPPAFCLPFSSHVLREGRGEGMYVVEVGREVGRKGVREGRRERERQVGYKR